MPVYTNAQKFAVDMLRKLHCISHNQLHWLIKREYPEVLAEKSMRQLTHLGNAKNDGQYYYWPGCVLNEDLVIALDIMIKMAGDGPTPIFDLAKPPCKLLFFLIRGENMRAFKVYAPKPGEEPRCMMAAETELLPPDHAAVFYVRNQRQMPLLKVSRPHIFAFRDGDGGYMFERGQV